MIDERTQLNQDYTAEQRFIIRKLNELASDLFDILSAEGDLLDIVIELYTDRSNNKYTSAEIANSIPEIFEELYGKHPEITRDRAFIPSGILKVLANKLAATTGFYYTNEEIELIKMMYQEGYDLHHIARELATIYPRTYESASIYKILKKLDLYRGYKMINPLYPNSYEPWTEEELEMISTWDKSGSELSKILLRSPHVINMKRRLLFGGSPVYWTDEDKLKLIEMWEQGISAEVIAKHLGRSENAVFWQVDRLGLKSPKFWTENDIDSLKSLFNEGYSYEKIGELLSRTKNAVRLKLKELGLKRGERAPDWSPEQIQLLIKLTQDGKSDEEIAEEINKTVIALRSKRSKLIKSDKFSLEG